MKLISTGAILLVCTTSLASAQQYGRTAYPDSWNGGAPLPPLGQTAPMRTQTYYVTPQPHAYYVAPQPYVTHTYTTRAYTTQPFYQQAPAVTGPPASRCVVANLNGTQWQQGCTQVRINPVDMPHLRKKFSNYQPNSGYVVNLPTDADY